MSCNERSTHHHGCDCWEEQHTRLRIAVTRAIGAFGDTKTVIVPDSPEQLEDAIRALEAEREKAVAAAKMLREDLLNWEASGAEPAGLEQTFAATAWLDEPARHEGGE